MTGIETTSPFVNMFRPRNMESGVESLKKEITHILRAIRTHLGMDVAFVSEFKEGHRVFRFVDSAPVDQKISVGDSDPLDESYCQQIILGRLPELIHDAAALDVARAMPATLALPVGAHLSVPIKLKDGRIYGTFCCFSFTPDNTLNERDLSMMRVFADLAAEQIENDMEQRQAHCGVEDRINKVLESNQLSVLYQPIYNLANKKITGYEALSRFSCEPYRTPDVWFSEALQVGLGRELELKAIGLALSGIDDLSDDEYISINVSPSFILNNDLERIFDCGTPERVILEVTEHVSIDDYSVLAERMSPLRAKGVRIAVDDAGAGYASFRHILNLKPDLIKLDASITRNIDTDYSRRALAIAFISFAQATDCEIIAEGVETAAQFVALRQLGVDKVQGHFIGKPMMLGRVPPPVPPIVLTQ